MQFVRVFEFQLVSFHFIIFKYFEKNYSGEGWPKIFWASCPIYLTLFASWGKLAHYFRQLLLFC
jgi:hypothetical protein